MHRLRNDQPKINEDRGENNMEVNVPLVVINEEEQKDERNEIVNEEIEE